MEVEVEVAAAAAGVVVVVVVVVAAAEGDLHWREHGPWEGWRSADQGGRSPRQRRSPDAAAMDTHHRSRVERARNMDLV